MFHGGQWEDDPHSDDNDQVVSVHEPVTASRVENSFDFRSPDHLPGANFTLVLV